MTKVAGKKLEGYHNYLPSLGEVWRSYRAVGTESPIDLDVAVFRRLARLAKHATLPNNTKAAKNGQNLLLGYIYYELGVGTHGKDDDEASRAFASSLHSVEALKPASAEELVKQQSLAHIINLMINRVDIPDVHGRTHEIRAAQNLGKLLVSGTEVLNDMSDRDERGGLYGALVEIAFTGTFLADPESTRIGLPTTARQNCPDSADTVSFTQVTNSRLSCSAVDLNILDYGATSTAPISSVPAQVKSAYHDHNNYSSNILMLYADRDLLVRNHHDLHNYGESLARFSGTPDMLLANAHTGIERALESHLAQVAVS